MRTATEAGQAAWRISVTSTDGAVCAGRCAGTHGVRSVPSGTLGGWYMAIVRTTHRAARVGHDRARGEWADMAGCTGPADARGGPGGSPALPCLTGLAGRAAAGLLLALAVLAAIMPMRASAQDKDAARAPNIVIVLADDLGYGDVGYLNSQSQIPTPNLDTLAGQGMAFLDAHSPAAVCTPTRYGLLTGRYAWRTRLTRGVLDGYDGPLIAPNRETLGSFLGATGYRTAVIGKWHLGLRFCEECLGRIRLRGAH